MATNIVMPKLGLAMEEGKVVQWLKKEMDTVSEGELLFSVESDKLEMEIESTDSGILRKILVPAGESAPVNTPIAIVTAPGEEWDESALTEISPTPQKAETAAPLATQPDTAQSRSEAPTKRVKASPMAKKVAKELGVNLEDMVPKGKGMISAEDVKAFAEAQKEKNQSAQTQPVPGTGVRERLVPLTGMRRVVAERMCQSKQSNAQTEHRVAVDMSEAVRMRMCLKDNGVKISYNDIIAFATCRALLEFPSVNASFTPDGILEKHYVNLGIAVAVEQGLLVPVVHGADSMSLSELSAAIRTKSEGARAGKLKPDDYQGGSFTISNLGMYGLDDFVAIINMAEAGILAVAAMKDTPVADGGEVKVKPMMNLTLGYDHRAVDGAPAAQFLMRVKQLIESPVLML